MGYRSFTTQLGQNIISNYLTVIWMAGLSIVLIPQYLKLIGADQWGLLAICMAMQGFLGLLDAGLGQIMPRNVVLASDSPAGIARTYKIFARTYIVLGLLGFAAGQATVSWLVGHWFKLSPALSDEATVALRLVLVQFLFQFGNSANVGYWVGIQTQKLANIRQCAFGTAKHAGALALMLLYDASAASYLMSFAIVSAFEFFANSATIRRNLGDTLATEVSFDDYIDLARIAGVLSIGVVLGMLVSQLDRLLLPRLVDSAVFGRYAIVANLGLAFMQLQYPLMRAIGPRIIQADFEDRPSSLKHIRIGLVLLCVLPCLITALAAPFLLDVWIEDSRIVLEGVWPLRLILGAVAVNSWFQLIYQRIISKGDVGVMSITNLINLLVSGTIILVTAPKIGVLAGGLAWLSSSCIQLIIGMYWIRKFDATTV